MIYISGALLNVFLILHNEYRVHTYFKARFGDDRRLRDPAYLLLMMSLLTICAALSWLATIIAVINVISSESDVLVDYDRYVHGKTSRQQPTRQQSSAPIEVNSASWTGRGDNDD